MRLVVTGGAGFIGSAIARALVARGDDVVIVDNLRTGRLENIPVQAQFVRADLADPEQLAQLDRLGGGPFDAVLHLGAQSSGEISHDDPIYDIDTNAKGTLSLLLWAERNRVKRFVNASSMGVYGQVQVQDCPIAETHPARPLSFYGVSKLAAEHYCGAFAARGMQVTSLRMFNVYGPGQNLDNMKQGMVSIYLAYLLARQPIIVKGSATRFRDFVFIDDVVRAWLGVLDSPVTVGRVYNVGTSDKTYVHEVLAHLLRAYGEDPSTYPIHYQDSTPGDQTGIVGDVSALARDIGWTPRVRLAEGFTRLAAHHPRGQSVPQ